MNNQLPMFVPNANMMKNSVPNDTVGLSSSKLDESQLNTTLFKFIASDQPSETKQRASDPPSEKKQRGRFGATARTEIRQMKKQEQAPIPDGTVGKCQTMREKILQLSLSPTIYRKKQRVHHPGNVDFGNKDDRILA